MTGSYDPAGNCRGAGNMGEPMEYLMSITKEKEKSYVVFYLLKLYIEKKNAASYSLGLPSFFTSLLS